MVRETGRIEVTRVPWQSGAELEIAPKLPQAFSHSGVECPGQISDGRTNGEVLFNLPCAIPQKIDVSESDGITPHDLPESAATRSPRQ